MISEYNHGCDSFPYGCPIIKPPLTDSGSFGVTHLSPDKYSSQASGLHVKHLRDSWQTESYKKLILQI